MAFALQTSLFLASVVSTVPFLTGYQTATVSDAQGNQLGTAFVARYVLVDEDQLSRDQRPQLRDLLERVKHGYGDSDFRGLALLAKEYLELAPLGGCAEIVLRLQHFTGVRYRVCSSPHQDVVRLFEDLSTSHRVFWLETTPDPDLQEKASAIMTALMVKLDEADGDPERVAELQAELRSKLAEVSEEAGPGRSPYNVHEYEVGGAWEEVMVSDPGQVEEILSKALVGSSSDFSSRLAQLLCVLRGVRNGASSDLAGVFASHHPLVLGTVDLDSELLGISCRAGDYSLHVVAGSVGPLPFQFLPVSEQIAEDYCADGKWEPPQVKLSFDKRVERMRSGRGW